MPSISEANAYIERLKSWAESGRITLASFERLSEEAARSLLPGHQPATPALQHCWRRDFLAWQKFMDDSDAKIDQESRQRAKEAFALKARAGSLSPMEVMAGQYTLFAEEMVWGVNRMAQMMIYLPPDQQIVCHNWYILSLYPESRQDIWGPKIKTLRYPLFPPGILEELNDQIIDIFDRQTLMGGSSEQEDTLYAGIFRLPENTPAKKRTTDGGAAIFDAP